ncbi:hypothetical protein J8273_2361 [Carpediemonas membranifera]|uniref:Uncharacterized protein n=1 Tax=Carpediemonas membranifera TaxID=201153 RepID=A0A8J6BEW4_9EUKA|nr:hypothetical protein J8273_2361 [Carpediemonas membranifera]|eukprot:KAG9396012.1 hypothetical protein J8273_2361 [Carpediemonas membranifera]
MLLSFNMTDFQDAGITDMSFSDDHRSMQFIRTIRNKDIDNVQFFIFNFDSTTIDDGAIDRHTADSQFTLPGVHDPTTGASNPASDRGATTPHLFVRTKVDKVAALAYDGTQLGSAKIADRTNAMPMICDGTYLYVCTQLEILRYSLDLELQANISVPSGRVDTNGQYIELYPHHKEGFSILLLTSTERLVGIDAAFTAADTTLPISDLTFLAPGVYPKLNGFVRYNTTSARVGFLQYAPEEDIWTFSESTMIYADGSVRLMLLSYDALNEVSIATTFFAGGFYSGCSSVELDEDLKPIAHTEQSVTRTNEDYPCQIENKCMFGDMRLYKDVAIFSNGTIVDGVMYEDVIFRFGVDSAYWMRVALAAVVLALAVLA